jgi:hypothetical protein
MNACNIELQYRYKPRKKCCLDFSKHQRILIQFQSPNLGILALGKRNLTPRGSKNQPGFWRLQTTSGIAFKVPQEAGFHVSISSIKWKEKMSSGEGKERGGQGRQSKVKKKKHKERPLFRDHREWTWIGGSVCDFQIRDIYTLY